MSIDQTILCSLCEKPFEKEYATFSNALNNILYACSRKCYVVFHTYMRAQQIADKENKIPKKHVTFKNPVEIVIKDAK